MMNKNPIEKEFIIKAKGLKKAASEAEESIINRITYIVKTIVDAWGYKLDTWYFDGAEEGEIGNLWSNYNEKEITPLILTKKSKSAGGTDLFHRFKNNLLFFDKFGGEWDLMESFPSRWLFEEFEQELLEGKKKWETLEQEKKEKLKSLSKEKMSFVEKAKKKLTKKELAALKAAL